jgi:hypothetical protein
MDELTPPDDLLKAVGAGLSSWSLVEIQLANLFGMISDMRDSNKAAALFSTIVSFEARLAVIDRLMTFETVDEVEAEMWIRMSAKLSKGYKKRHEMAHFSVDRDKRDQPVISPFLTLDRLFSDNKAQLSLSQLLERCQKFIDLHMAVHWFTTRAFFRRGLPEERQQQPTQEPPLVPQLRELAIQILEERKRREK